LLSLIVLGVAAVVIWLVSGSIAATLVLMAAGGLLMWLSPLPDEPEQLVETPETIDPVQPLIDAVAEPLMIIADGRVSHANGAAFALLGTHIVGEQARLAIRHPAAIERLTGPIGALPRAPIELVGLGTREARWEMHVSAFGPDRRVIHLNDRTGSHAAERMRVDFVANASHELRTPLAAILGFVETLGDDKAGGDPATRKRFLKVMNDEARRMQRLVDDLMSLSRIEAEKYRLPDTPVDLAQLANEVHAILTDSGSERGRDLVADIADPLPRVVGDRAQLSQLIHNLIGNAMKYGRPGTPVTLRAEPAGDATVRLTVTDEGEGIAPEHLPRLTERFYRVDSGRSRAMGGTGLGLAIVKHIVERHRGRLDISSAPGIGTTVTVLLPVAPPVSSNHNISVTQDE
jgi:two-component system phosphate regulon sensor histidine kinase PhoR